MSSIKAASGTTLAGDAWPRRGCVPMRKASCLAREMCADTAEDETPFSICFFQGFSLSGRSQMPEGGTWRGGEVHTVCGTCPGSTTISVAPTPITSPRCSAYPRGDMRVQFELTKVPFDDASPESLFPSFSTTEPSGVSSRYAWNLLTWSSARRQMALCRERPMPGFSRSEGTRKMDWMYLPSLMRRWNCGSCSSSSRHAHARVLSLLASASQRCTLFLFSRVCTAADSVLPSDTLPASSRAKSHGQAVPLVSGDLAAPDSNALAPSAAMRKLVAADAERMVLPPINESSDSMPPSRPPAGAM
mmetsp:Transcript_5324/g.12850  ORF Transcript_5324/g.12850 Transcript_5324/m.12850 type:complete len:303 (+) Transcript_5324:107-1015(+)